MYEEIIGHAIRESIKIKQYVLDDQHLISIIDIVAEEIINAFRHDKKVLLCGNGGSAADAQHLAAELSGRFYIDRPPLFAEALHFNTSYLTAVANDYSFDEVYARLVRAKGRPEDVLIAISASGNSLNIIKAINVARELDMIVVGFTGQTGGRMASLCNYLINIPSQDTARIQEAHILIGHIICEIVERELFST